MKTSENFMRKMSSFFEDLADAYFTFRYYPRTFKKSLVKKLKQNCQNLFLKIGEKFLKMKEKTLVSIRKKIAEEILGQANVYLFGSLVKGKYTSASDVDVLIVSKSLFPNWKKNRWIKTKIKSKIDPFSPFQFHLARPKEFENWFKKFIKEDLVKIE